jgi:hypothetical protein
MLNLKSKFCEVVKSEIFLKLLKFEISSYFPCFGPAPLAFWTFLVLLSSPLFVVAALIPPWLQLLHSYPLASGEPPSRSFGNPEHSTLGCCLSSCCSNPLVEATSASLSTQPVALPISKAKPRTVFCSYNTL